LLFAREQEKYDFKAKRNANRKRQEKAKKANNDKHSIAN